MVDMSPLVLHTNPEAILKTLAIACFAWLAGITLALAPLWEPRLPAYLRASPIVIGPKSSVLAGILGLFVAILATFLLWQMVRYPEIIVDEVGIHRPPSMVIPWEQIESVACLPEEEKVVITLTADNTLVGKTEVLTNPHIISPLLSPEDFRKLCQRLEQGMLFRK